MISTKTRTILKIVSIVLAFAILLGGHLLANNFLVSQENNNPKAETTTTTMNGVSITYNNTYGAVTDASSEGGGLLGFRRD